MKKIIYLVLAVFAFGCQSSNVKVAKNGESVFKNESENPNWNTSDGPTYYLYSSYYQEGAWVEIPAKIGGAIGVIPGTAVGVVIGLPALPWYNYETTIFGSQMFFGRGVSLLVGLPFYVTKVILYDVPKSAFTE